MERTATSPHATAICRGVDDAVGDERPAGDGLGDAAAVGLLLGAGLAEGEGVGRTAEGDTDGEQAVIAIAAARHVALIACHRRTPNRFRSAHEAAGLVARNREGMFQIGNDATRGTSADWHMFTGVARDVEVHIAALDRRLTLP